MWKPITADKPEAGVVVTTKIDDGQGVRNEQRLKRMVGNKMWWVPDGSIYVYYTPTHYLEGSEEYSLNLTDYLVKQT